MVYGGVCGFSNNALFSDLEKYEAEVIPVLTAILSKTAKPVIIDVGANNGQWMILFKALSKNASVHCFEPFPQLCEFLRELVARNSFQGVEISKKLLGEISETGELHFADLAMDVASTVADFQPDYNKTIRVEKLTIDDYVEDRKIEKIHLIKIDVEGGELEVLTGAQKVLSKMQPYLLLELLYTENERHLQRQKTVEKLLKNLGYEFYHIGEKGALYQQDVVAPDPTYTYLNYIVSPSTLTFHRP